MIITKDQESYLDAAVGSSDKDAFMQSETAQMLQDAGADPNASYELDLPPPDEPDDNEILEIDMLNPKHAEGQKFNFMSKIVHDHHYGVGDYAKAGDENLERMRSQNPRSYGVRMQSRQKASSRGVEDLSKFGVEFGGDLNWNMSSGLLKWSQLDDLPPEVAMATAGVLEMYEKLPPGTWSGTKRLLKGVGGDPFTYLGGVGGFKAVQALMRGGGIAAGRSKLAQAAARTAGFGVLASEGSAYGAVSEYMMQRLKHDPSSGEFKPDWNNVFLVGGFSGAAAAALPVAGPAALRGAQAMYRGGRDAFNNTIEAAQEGALASGVGPLPANPNRAGTQLAQQPDEMGFRSGLINMLDALPESASGEQILATLSNPERLGEFGAKAEEIVLTGLDKYLSEVDGPVTKQMVADFLQANRVRLDEARDLGGGSYMPGEYNSIDGEVYDFDELISDQGSTSPWVFDRGYVSGYRDEGDDTIDVMITKEFPIDDGFRNNEVLDEVELIIDNESLFYSSDPRSTEEGIAAGVRAKEIIGELRELYGPGASRNNDVAKAEILYSDLEDTLSEVQPGIVFGTMEQRADYELYDAADDFYIGAANSADEANHQAARHIESIDNDGEGVGQYSSVTFPTESGEAPANYKEVRLLMPEDDPRFPQTDSNQHFEENTFAHYRSTDRQVVIDQPDQPDMFGGGDPQRVMFVEEIQSDLMQAGGKRGYKTAEVMDTWKAEGTEIQTRMKDKLTAFGYGDEVTQEADVAIMQNLTGLYEGFSRMMKDKDRVSAMQKYLDVKLKSNAATYGDLHDETKGIIMAAINSLPNKKMKDEQLYDAFGQFVAALASLRGGGNEVGGVVRDLSPIRYGNKMVDSDGYDRGLEFLDKLNSKDLRDFYRSRDKAIIAQSGLPDIPLKKDWVELTMKRAIYDAIEEGQTMIAFPNHAETVGAIEYGGKPATGAIKRLYEADIPKLVKKLAKQTGGEVKTGAIANSSKATQSSDQYPSQGSVIILDLSKDPQKVKREGFAIPVITGGATALTAAQQMQQQDQQPTQ